MTALTDTDRQLATAFAAVTDTDPSDVERALAADPHCRRLAERVVALETSRPAFQATMAAHRRRLLAH